MADKIGNKEQLQAAANLRVDFITPHLFQLLGYRQRIAQELANSYASQNFHFGAALADFEQCNENIKKLLNL